MTKKTDFEIVQIDSDMVPGFTKKRFYHPGLVYKPAERVLIMATRYSKEQRNKGTSQKILKVLQRFCQWFQNKIQDRENLAGHIARFERIVTVADLEEWQCYRDISRVGNCPSDAHINADTAEVARFLDWAKERIQKRGGIVAFEGGRKVRRIHHLRITDMYKGMQGPLVLESTRYDIRLDRKPEIGESATKKARRKQTKGHEYLTDKELGIFFKSFYDQVWKFVCMAGYHTGVRPSEVLAIPRLTMRGSEIFTSDPAVLSSMMAKGVKEITWWCLGKGEKVRPVKFMVKHWHALMSSYEPLFQERKKLYERLTGKELAPEYLWLARPWRSGGCPRIIHCLLGDQANYEKYEKPLWNAIAEARTRHKLEELFGHGVDYYSLRHSFATNFLASNIVAEKMKRESDGLPVKDTSSIIYDLNLRDRLMNQMGHDHFATTWDSYIHNAAVVGEMGLPSILDFIESDDADTDR